MPLFRKSTVTETQPAARTAPPVNSATSPLVPAKSTNGSFFSRNSRTSADGFATSTSLADAHAKLDAAVASERAADLALRDARLAVKDARDMVARLEREAKREAEAANAKLKEARSMKKSAGALGKFGSA